MCIKNIVVFCGSSMGAKEIYSIEADRVGRRIAEKGHRLVYGGGCLGLMDIVSDAALNAGGEVVGIMPRIFDVAVVGEKKLTSSLSVKDLPERKIKMLEMADVFIALPGGFGTLDELGEVLAAAQLEQISAPIGLLNTEGFFDATLAQLDKMVAEGFLKPVHRTLLIEGKDTQELFQKIDVLS